MPNNISGILKRKTEMFENIKSIVQDVDQSIGLLTMLKGMAHQKMFPVLFLVLVFHEYS